MAAKGFRQIGSEKAAAKRITYALKLRENPIAHFIYLKERFDGPVRPWLCDSTSMVINVAAGGIDVSAKSGKSAAREKLRGMMP
ncbi:hypothetical protein LB565_22705 [Mesorhizobium sp. CA14]|uniref:hypothetical protein n=1 Tax=Mesorhizobium sp. CA14 TaxID=2876642 RepID=UPI001CCA5046|nr:hypothetical protein [Mesorhizobium sp. CA14]MBZ9850803.1 hypothetical protein [Mesorhizobium sp. CA14]